MKNVYIKTIKAFLIAGLMFMTTASNAQIIFDDDVEDVPAAPIDGFIGVGLLAGAYIILRKKNKSDI